ncbi:SDR family NAD(P)-dependent oxidoreductase [Streptomyces yatensis]|uniref:Ketosynthase family 3 (KS3) domain-containing protein n=1 Tax=Streptomyces yatensis TaxID=155177 RepID=A0ABN2HQK4_9ACTN
MSSAVDAGDLVIGITPLGEPDARLAAAVSRAGGLGVLDLGTTGREALQAWEDIGEWAADGRYGVRVAAGCRLTPVDLPDGTATGGPPGGAPGPHTVVLGVDAPWPVEAVSDRCRVLAEVTDPDEALAAIRAGAHGLIARGSESGGRIGALSTFVLLQRLLADPRVSLPVWACGGIGPRTAAASVLGGAAGVVLDTQLALLAESGLPEDRAAAIRSMDGSETTVVDGHRVLRRRGRGTQHIEPNLTVGQDGFLAAQFAERWRDAGRTVRGITDAVREAAHEAVRNGSAVSALRPGAPLSTRLGTRLPLAQGPMTRVSDQGAFASVVAAGGALPFIALALAGREQARAMLEEAATALDGRPWGVGVLGFAPEEIRNAQLEAVREIRPSHAIVAGGRPSQAKALERDGIATYLHVPSPGLLRQFLQAGARRFVFEGSECGGHVGPRNSFPLWEAQIAVVEDFLDDTAHDARHTANAQGTQGTAGADDTDGAGIEIFFAGGVHDERSAAMVAALAAPLTRRGVAVGSLMGTAYLFTEEAVAHGAVQPLFQRQVVAAEHTVLLETAPGHATRCVPSPFTESFDTVKERLRNQGLPDREVWERLERLNVGRLRIASKGMDRGPDGALTSVDEEHQLSGGMFMAGQVAVLRSATTTIAALHHAVGTGAADFLTARAEVVCEGLGVASAPAAAEAPAPLDVAVVGMACMFPQAPDLAAFWANVVGGVDAVTEVPAERWDPAVHYTGDKDGASASKWGGFLPPIPFDPLRYGIPPASLGSIEPVQLLALEAARRALDDAGYGDPGDGGRTFDRAHTSVVFGAEAGSDLSNAQTLRAVLPRYVREVPEGLADQLPRLTEDSFPGMLANVISGRIANRLDLGGANYTVDAACASSLAAVDVACKELTAGTSDLVLCGGADLHNGINDYVLFSSVHALSPTGRSRTFDSSADGIALGEGVACVVLKRLADAERDGDRVYGVIKGVGSSSDGRSLGLTAPRPEGQRAALERAYANARLSPADVGLIEAHGTGTVVGDRTELTVLGEVFTDAGAAPGACALGSVKSQIGHTKCAAGLAGLVKAAMALYTGITPPTLHLTRPNTAWDADRSPFAFHTRARPWAAASAERVAGVSAFGFGGTNFHVVLAAHGRGAPPAQGLDAWPAELFLFRGADRAAALRVVRETLDQLVANDTAGRPWRLRDLALTASRRADAGHEPVRVAVVAADLDDLAARLRQVLAGDPPGPGPRGADGLHIAPEAAEEAGTGEAGAEEARTGEAGAEPKRGKVAFLFPGQGSQRPGMFADAFVTFPGLQRQLRHGRAYADALYPPAAFDEAGQAAQRTAITDTRVAQPALGMVGLAAYTLLTSAGVRPDMAAGHSYGELVALCAAGALDPRTLPGLSAERAGAILGASEAAGEEPGTMAAVTAAPGEVEPVLGAAGLAERVVTANHNAPRQTVISGPERDVQEAVRLLRAAGHSAKRIPVACAFHSPLVAGAGARFAEALARHPVRAAEFPVWANRTAAPHGAEPAAIRAELAAQIGAPVRFVAQIEAMYEAGARIFVEAGPGTVLTRLVGEILDGRPHLALACEGRRTGSAGPRGFLDTLARLAVAGVPVRTAWLFHGRDAVAAGSAPPPKRPGWTVDGHLVRTADGELLPGALAPARRVMEATVSQTERTGGGEDGGRDALISEFLRTSREMIAAQRDVLLTYFGGAPGERHASPPAPVVAAAPLPAEFGPVAAVPVAATSGASVPVAAVAPVSAPPAPATGPDVLRAVSEIISERTGYPVDMIEPDLDLEADLSIDSIKRAEIAGELARRLGAAGADTAALGDEELEELAKARTTAAVTDWLTARLAPPAPVASATATRAPEPVAAGVEAGPVGVVEPEPVSEPVSEPLAVSGVAPKRLRLVPVPLGAPEDGATAPPELTGRRFALLGGEGDGVADAVAARLGEHGAETVRLAAGHPLTEEDGRVDGVLLLDPLATSGAPVLPDAFTALQAALRRAPHWLLALRRADPLATRTAGLRGVFRTVAREYPDIVTRLVEFPADLAGSADVAGPADVAGSAEVAGSADVTGSAEVAGSADAAGPAEVVGSGEVVGSAQVAGPAEVVGPAGVLGSADVAGSAEVAGSADVTESAEVASPADVADPAKVAASADAAGFGDAAGPAHVADSANAPGSPDESGFPDAPDCPGAPESPDEPTFADTVAHGLLDELLAPDRTPVVLRTAEGGRHRLDLVETPLGALAGSGAGPAGDGAAEVAALGLDRDAVVVLVGGARGITARCAATFASAARCRIELLGRTPEPVGPEDPATAGARDETALRAALAARGGLGPAEIQQEAARILARREVAATIEELTALGGRVRYRSVDFRDAEAVLQAVKQIHADHGRLDGVVYGAGVIEDRLIAEKSAESFQRVYGTKVEGARTLLDALAELPEPPSFAVLFGSIAAALGNRGQVDYAAANDTLETLGARWRDRTGRRALTVHWGPWAPTGPHGGMVTPELGREYARRGISLIDPEEGTLALLRELAWGEESAGSVVYTASGW